MMFLFGEIYICGKVIRYKKKSNLLELDVSDEVKKQKQ